MDWIKKNPHLLVLVLIALGALGASVMLVTNASGFSEKFQGVQQNVVKGTKVYEQEKQTVEKAEMEFQKPAEWKAGDENGSLFVSNSYMIDPKLQKPMSPNVGSILTDSLTKKPIPNALFFKNKLNPLIKGIQYQDPDGDGFRNEDELRENTNPNDKASHPPYYTRLFVKKYVRVPFLLKFQSADYDPKKPEEATFGINPVTLKRPTQFLKIGDTVAGTKFKLQSFKPNLVTGADGIERDLSELTLLDTEFKTTIVLIKDKITDSPESFSDFLYLWPTPSIQFQVKKLGVFVLKPEIDQKYKLLDINEQGAQIQTPSGETVTIPNLPAGYPPF